ncbi:kinesin [Naegleria gruberi]|uniref:Kinesin-like protein n=1 Tax=Naegleria gruberi TaxID=5762 RepID=D2W4L3_NAEGR|nr:kinesin [Naegleria gruberi]EFC35988.1 kinesin [Naegleria gruberi]|eukprot:XP_002668732.1 kinesin [Naegleria gruberi]
MFQQPQSFSSMKKNPNTNNMNTTNNMTNNPQQINYMQQQQQYMMMMDPNAMNQTVTSPTLLQQQQQYMNMIAATMMNQQQLPSNNYSKPPNTINNMNYQLQQQQQPSSNISISNLPQSNMIGSNNNVTTTSTTKSVSFNPSSTNLSSSTASSNMTNTHSTSQLSAQNINTINTKTKTLLNNPNTSIIGNNPTISNNTVSNTTANNATSTAATSASNNNNSLVSSTSTNTNTNTTTTTSNNNTTRVKVVVRVRPQVSEDISNSQIFGEYPPCVATVKNTVILKRECYDDREFTFDKVLEPTCSQDEMYKQVGKNIVNDVLKGYNGTVLAYGQTGSGKTFTIFGSSTDPKRIIKPNENIIDKYSGVIPRCINQIFEHVQEYSNNTEFRVFVSFMQIYMENIMDLLDASKTNLPIREDPKNGVFVEQLTQVQVNEPYEVMQLIKEGSKNRQVNSTNMNKLSSRSHVILMITVEQKSSSDKSVKRGVLHIVDLAGSERVFKSGSEGQRLEEAKKINKSLSALGNCVAALTEENVYHVPFRDSKLTRLLTDSLGGNAKTCLVATIGPSMWNYDESYSTLHFANRAMNDPFSRKKAWNLIHKMKKGRAMILTTHAMDEADYLSDRIAIMAHGQLKCIGDSLSIKSQYGSGYNLLVVANNGYEKQVVKTINQYLTNVKIVSQSAGNFIFNVPKEQVNELGQLISYLEKLTSENTLNNNGTSINGNTNMIKDWGISQTTLEEVYLKVTQNSEFSYKNDDNAISMGNMSEIAEEQELIEHNNTVPNVVSLNDVSEMTNNAEE